MKAKTEIAVHYAKIRTILIWILALNWLVAFAKILYGYSTRCWSMTADGFHSLSDGTSNIICLIGIHFACQPVDRDHPYGHKKYETFFSLVIAALLFIVCFNLAKEGVERIRNPIAPQVDAVSFIIMLATLGTNIWVMRYEYAQGKRLKSDLLVSDSLHTKADILTSLAVISGLVAMKINHHLIIVDPVVTLLISLFIAQAAFEIIRESSRVLCDSAVIMDEQKISDIVNAIPGVEACHKIRTRGRQDDIHIDLHAQVKADMRMDQAHRISYQIEEALKRGIDGVTDVIVHMEPRDEAKGLSR